VLLLGSLIFLNPEHAGNAFLQNIGKPLFIVTARIASVLTNMMIDEEWCLLGCYAVLLL
jgi:hypothetical protein